MHGQFIDRVLDISVAHREGTRSANCAEDCSWCRRPCDQQRQVPAVQRFESSCPRFSSSLSGEHSCCATGAVLGQGGDLPVVATTGAVLGVLGSC